MNKEEKQLEKNLKHSIGVVNSFNDVEDLYELFKKNPESQDVLLETIRPYLKSKYFWKFLLNASADYPKLRKQIQKIIKNQ